MVVFSAVKWIPHAQKQALIILAVQIFAAILPISVVFFLKL